MLVLFAAISWNIISRKNDVIYSSLTFLHIKEKQFAIEKIANLLKTGGTFILSIDKNQDKVIDTGESTIQIYPDCPKEIKGYAHNANMFVEREFEKEFSHIFIIKKT